jgi:hypothetical protein
MWKIERNLLGVHIYNKECNIVEGGRGLNQLGATNLQQGEQASASKNGDVFSRQTNPTAKP